MGVKRYSIQIPVRWAVNTYTGNEMWPPISPTDEDIKIYKDWCKKNVGANRWNYYGVCKNNPCQFIFKSEEDLLAFKLVFGI